MRFSEAWLREWVNPPVGTDELAEQLTMAGLEVDSVEPVAGAFEGVVVGAVLERSPHPDADKLSVCRVDAGEGEPLQIVCGARNVAAGMKVPVARVGARLPGDFRIKRAKLRGVESSGMICSASELGLAETSEGIMGLSADAPVGQDFRAFLALEDHAIEIDLTPDRGDCLGVAGIAREVGVLNRSPVTPPAMDPVAPAIDERFPVRLEAPEACPRYTCRVVRGIDPTAETPLWMRERLRRSGLRSLGPVVDVTNYVLLELGQPMHAFDLDLLQSAVHVRMAAPGERLTLLDGTETELRDDTLVIADDDRPLALAGIMGGEGSGVTQSTRAVLLESAFFAPTAITGRPRAYGLQTDSSYRFERGVDPQLQVRAMERATALLLEICGGQAGPVVEAASEAHLPERPRIRLRRERISRVLGVTVDDEAVVDILERLGMEVAAAADGWDVTPPGSRFDIGIEVDLIEEVGRIHGYARIPVNRGAYSHTTMPPVRETAFDLEKARRVLTARDYQEAVTYSFVPPELDALLDPEHAAIALANPLSADMAVMRTSLWTGLIQTARHNQARQQERVRLFETGLRFHREGTAIRQEPMLSGLVAGPALPEQWGAAARPADFYDVKADVEAVLALTGAGEAFELVPGAHPALHPGQSARIERAGELVGWLGMVHPELEARLDLAGHTFVFELRIDGLLQGRLPSFEPLSRFPSIRRDLAIVVDRSVSYAQVRRCVERAAPDTLQAMRLFDVYTGDKVDSEARSLALGLILQDSSHTLTDEEVDAAMEAVLEALATDLGAALRE
jgi:phenylalanyl-tRNA synthetase beta chain